MTEPSPITKVLRYEIPLEGYVLSITTTHGDPHVTLGLHYGGKPRPSHEVQVVKDELRHVLNVLLHDGM